MLVEYQRLAAPGPTFLDSYAILGAQRNAKIVGIFTRLWQRDGKPRYLDLLPRVWGYLERDLAHPALAEVLIWFDKNIPSNKRGSYVKEAA
jgi:aminoglycoside/choline kinase family phosphotransferase